MTLQGSTSFEVSTPNTSGLVESVYIILNSNYNAFNSETIYLGPPLNETVSRSMAR
jgi:hypothetical protein